MELPIYLLPADINLEAPENERQEIVIPDQTFDSLFMKGILWRFMSWRSSKKMNHNDLKTNNLSLKKLETENFVGFKILCFHLLIILSFFEALQRKEE